MKILHVISSTDPRGGGPIEMVNATSEVWVKHGHTSDIASLDKPEAPWLQTAVRTTALGLPGRMVGRLPGRGYSFSPRLAPWLRRHSGDYDAVLLHGLWNYGSYGSWRGLHGAPTPYFVFTHGMLDPYFVEAYPTKARLKALYWTLFENKVLRDAHGVLFTTEEERDLAARSFQPYRARPLVAGLGARDVTGDEEAGRRAFLAKVPSAAGRRFILFLSRIHPKKGVDLLVRAFAAQARRYPDLDLVIAGPDQVGLQRELEALAATLGIADRIAWPGMLTGDAKRGAFQAALFFALPSHQENFGIAIAEALAYGTPVLITNKVNIWPQIEADGAGLVVTDEAASVETGVGQLAGMTEAERQSLSLKARECFLRRFELERVSLDLLDLIARHTERGEEAALAGAPVLGRAASAPAHAGGPAPAGPPGSRPSP